jgi:hypothetical protein
MAIGVDLRLKLVICLLVPSLSFHCELLLIANETNLKKCLFSDVSTQFHLALANI